METETIENATEMRALYDAARRAKHQSTKGRTFEEWHAKVSDDGLFNARHALEVEISKERSRLAREVIEAAKAERKASLDYDKRMILENWRQTVDTRQQRESAVDALIEFESQHLLKK